MPTVPSTNNVVALNQPQMRPTLVDNTYKMMAAAELHQDNQPGPMAQLFIQRMQASISLDRRNKGNDQSIIPGAIQEANRIDK